MPAAFGRLCVETVHRITFDDALAQPPSGGCVLKPGCRLPEIKIRPQPPSGGCVLKLVFLIPRQIFV